MNSLETIKTHDIPSVGDLVLIARNSAGFYDAAARKVANPGLKTLFGDMAKTRAQFVEGAEKQIRNSAGQAATAAKTAQTPAGDRVVLEWRQFYTDLQPKIEEKSMTFVDQLVASETRLLTAFDKLAADEIAPPGVKEVVTGFLPILRRQHSIVVGREWAKAA